MLSLFTPQEPLHRWILQFLNHLNCQCSSWIPFCRNYKRLMKNGPETPLNLLSLEKDLEVVCAWEGTWHQRKMKQLKEWTRKYSMCVPSYCVMLKVFSFLLPLLNCKNVYLIFKTSSPDNLKVRRSCNLHGKSRKQPLCPANVSEILP